MTKTVATQPQTIEYRTSTPIHGASWRGSSDDLGTFET